MAPLNSLLEELEDSNTPAEPILRPRASSYSDFYHTVRTQVAKDAQRKKRQDTEKRRRDRTREALALEGKAENIQLIRKPTLEHYDDQLLDASQQDYLYAAPSAVSRSVLTP